MSMDTNGVIGYGIDLGEDEDNHLLPNTENGNHTTIKVQGYGAADHDQSGDMLIIANSCEECWELVSAIDPSHFVVQSWWDAELKKYCKDNNLKYKTPKWLLSWHWT